MDKKYNPTIDLIRVIACLLIVWNHTSGLMLNGKGNPLSWANIGVQVFFFMSGFLYSTKSIGNGLDWLKKNVLKLMKPYWIYIVVALPVIALLASGEVTWVKALAAYIGIQGFGFEIAGLGQHWFISYMLICYLITPFILNRLKPQIGGGYCWIILAGSVVAIQTITIPFALWFQFKAAYIFTYVFGYVYGYRYESEDYGVRWNSERKIVDILIVTIAILGWFGRLFLDTKELSGLWENIGDLFVQWVKLLQGAGMFIIPYHLIRNWKGNRLVHKLAGVTYEIYLVHELFLHDFITKFYPGGIAVKILCAWILVAASTWALIRVNAATDTMGRKKLGKGSISGS